MEKMLKGRSHHPLFFVAIFTWFEIEVGGLIDWLIYIINTTLVLYESFHFNLQNLIL
jgi:hypothetical protein